MSAGLNVAEVTGVDCSRPLDEAARLALTQAFDKHPVIVVRDQNLTPAQYSELLRLFGTADVMHDGVPAGAGTRTSLLDAQLANATDGTVGAKSLIYALPHQPDVVVMTNELRTDLPSLGSVDAPDAWHADGSHKPAPYSVIALHALQLPPSGGDTAFCSMELLFEALTPAQRRTLAGRTATHQWSKVHNPRLASTLSPEDRVEHERIALLAPAVSQPLVRTHPTTGRASLFISPRFTLAVDEMEAADSENLLSALFTLMEDPRFHYRHVWRSGDVLIWDNRCLTHRAYDGYAGTQLRRMYRITLAGQRPYYRGNTARMDPRARALGLA